MGGTCIKHENVDEKQNYREPLLMSAVGWPLDGWCDSIDLADMLLLSADERLPPRLAERLLLSDDSKASFVGMPSSPSSRLVLRSRLALRWPRHSTSKGSYWHCITTIDTTAGPYWLRSSTNVNHHWHRRLVTVLLPSTPWVKKNQTPNSCP